MSDLGLSVSICEDVLFRDLDGEAVLLNEATGQYYGLNEMGTRIWAELIRHGRLADVLRRLTEEYDVTEAELRRDLLAFIEELVSHGLVEVDDT